MDTNGMTSQRLSPMGGKRKPLLGPLRCGFCSIASAIGREGYGPRIGG